MDELSDNLTNALSINQKTNAEMDVLAEMMEDTTIKTFEEDTGIIRRQWDAGMYGINNYEVSIPNIDLEDFMWMKLILPEIVINELEVSGFTSYRSYFEAYCCNSDTNVIDLEIILEVAQLFDDIFTKKKINFEAVGQLINNVNIAFDELTREDSWIQEYFVDYIYDIINGISVINNLLSYYIEDFDVSRYSAMIRLSNNLCVCIIYLQMTFNSNIFTQNSNDDDMILFINA